VVLSFRWVDAEAYPLSTYVVGDFDSESGLALVKEALESLTETSNARLSFIPNPTHVNAFGPESRSALLSILARSGSLTKWSSKEAMGVLKSALGITLPASDGAQAPLSKPDAVEKISKGIDFSAENYAECLRAGRVFLKQLKIEPGQLAVIVNGRVRNICDFPALILC
jgi:UDP-glucose:glycoprotein glucosyltransferase